MTKLKKASLSPADAEILVAQYDALRKQETEIKKQKEKISDQLKMYADTAGVQDDKGSKYVKTDNFVFGKQARTGVNFVHDVAVDALTKRGLTDAIDIIRAVNEEKFEQLVGEGKISVDEFVDIGAITSKTTFAIFVKSVEEMSEVEVAQLTKG